MTSVRIKARAAIAGEPERSLELLAPSPNIMVDEKACGEMVDAGVELVIEQVVGQIRKAVRANGPSVVVVDITVAQ